MIKTTHTIGLFVAVVFFVLIIPIQGAVAYEGHESALWTEVSLRHRVAKKFDFVTSGYWRFDEFAASTDKVMGQWGVRYRPNKYFRITPGYRQIHDAKKNGAFELVHRLFVDLSLRKRLKPISLSYRLRLQREYEGDKPLQEDRVRNKLELKWGLSSAVKPLISSELYFTQEDKGWVHTRYRNAVGVEWSLGEHELSLRYLHNWPVDDVEDPLKHILSLGYGFEW